MFENNYSLYLKPNKGFISPVEAHPKSKDICQHIDFLRNYYRQSPVEYTEKGSYHFPKVVLQSAEAEIIFYLNIDEEGTSDYVIYSLGLVTKVPYTKALKLLIGFDCPHVRATMETYVR